MRGRIGWKHEPLRDQVWLVFQSDSGRARRFAAPPNGALRVFVSLWLGTCGLR